MKESDSSQPIATSLTSAGVEILVLFLLRQKPMYTYDLADEIKKMCGSLLPVPRLYNTMVKLKTSGIITEAVREIVGNRARVYYTLTDKGIGQLEQMTELIRFLYETLGIQGEREEKYDNKK